jgi:hypothetical protein
MKTVRRAQDEALIWVFGHVAFAVCMLVCVGLWMLFFYMLDMIFPTKSPTGKNIIAILQMIATVTSLAGAWLGTRWLLRPQMRPPSPEPSSASASSTFRVARWVPLEKKFYYVGAPFSYLAQARERAAIERLQDLDARFAVFDQNLRMVENEAGRLVR